MHAPHILLKLNSRSQIKSKYGTRINKSCVLVRWPASSILIELSHRAWHSPSPFSSPPPFQYNQKEPICFRKSLVLSPLVTFFNKRCSQLFFFYVDSHLFWTLYFFILIKLLTGLKTPINCCTCLHFFLLFFSNQLSGKLHLLYTIASRARFAHDNECNVNLLSKLLSYLVKNVWIGCILYCGVSVVNLFFKCWFIFVLS